MKQQTAVEWLWNLSQTKELQASDFEQALAMEAEQLNQACYDGYYQEEMMDTREYFNNTYGTSSQKKS